MTVEELRDVLALYPDDMEVVMQDEGETFKVVGADRTNIATQKYTVHEVVVLDIYWG